MAWSKVDDRLFAHPKVLAAGVAAMGLWVVSMSYAACYSTDGNVPSNAIQVLAASLASNQALLPNASEASSSNHASLLAERLVEVGLWERTEQGYRFHDWEQYNPTKRAQVSETTNGKRMSRAEAGRLGGLKRQANKQALEASKGLAVLGSNASSNRSPVPVPVPDSVPEEEGEKGARVLPPSEPNPPPPPQQETPPRREAEPSPEQVIAGAVAEILERRSDRVLDRVALNTGDFYKLGRLALELKEKHGINANEWAVLGKWLSPSGPGLKQRSAKDLAPSWAILLRRDGEWMRDCMKQALDWNAKKNDASEYTGR